MKRILKVSTALTTLVLLNLACGDSVQDQAVDPNAYQINTTIRGYPTDADAKATANTSSIDQRTTGGSTDMNNMGTQGTTGTTLQKTNRTPTNEPVRRTGPAVEMDPANGTDKIKR